MVALSLYSMGRFTTFCNYSAQVENTGNIITYIRSAEISIRDIGLNERGYMISQDTMYLNNLNGAVDSVNKYLAAIKLMISDNQVQKKNLVLVKGAVALRIAAARANISYVDSTHSSAESDYYDKSRMLMLECTQRLGEMLQVETRLRSDKFRGELFYGHLTDKTLKYLLPVFCVITLMLFLLMIKELRKRMIYQEELQATVIDLRRSHNELEEIAFVTSHDLQEPLRKIQVFSSLLQGKKVDGNVKVIEDVCSRLILAAGRVQSLVIALMNLTSLMKADEPESEVDLNQIAKSLVDEFKTVLTRNSAHIEIRQLPVIKGYNEQLKILFRSLLDNALKFTNKGIPPSVTISYSIVPGYELAEINKNLVNQKFHCIIFADNGIGFDKKFVFKIFRIFQRLHNQDSQYDGKGIGLAISQRIMSNHKGYITADGDPGNGATFKLFFPF